MIPYGRQQITEEDIQAVVDVLRSDWLTQGPVVPKFESAMCHYTGATHAVAVSSGTSALHLACRALDLGPGDILWTSAITFVASANCALYCGATIDFVDIDPQTHNISIEALKDKLEKAKKENKLPSVVIPVHMAGLPCDMQAIATLAKQYGFYLIEDACHAIGGSFKESRVGSCKYSDITVFSFHPVKTITTGEGGMATTNNKILARKMSLLRSHGITRDVEEMTREPDGPWFYQQIDLGYNYRLTDFQAALGLSQLQSLDEFVAQRHTVAKRYDEQLSNLPVELPHKDENSYSGLHLYVIRLRLDEITVSHRHVFESLHGNGIGVNLHYIPVYSQPYYQKMGFDPDNFPEANRYYKSAISLPIYPGLTEEQQNVVVHALKEGLCA